MSLAPKIRLETLVSDSLVDQAVEALLPPPRARFGDGKIFVLDVAAAYRIRTRETGEAAL